MKNFYFFEAYEMAALIQESAKYSSSFIEIPWELPDTLACLTKYSKISLLHYYIACTIAVHYRRDYRKNSDFIDEERIEYIEGGLSTYGVIFQPFADFSRNQNEEFKAEPIGEQFYVWFLDQESAFMTLWDHMTAEVFHLLFSDRQFLLTFNQSLSEYLESGDVSIPASYLTAKGHLKRRKDFPEWLRRAIFFRDRGKCVFCQIDLSGLLNTDFKRHLDHIVPLYLWGTNDPCNIQLTCEKCNLNKSKRPGSTSPKYVPYWDD